MTATTIRVQMAQRKDTAANWTAANPILLSGEIGYETDTKKFKIGDGSTAWNSLAYLPIPDGSGNLTITGNLEIGSTGSLTFEGGTADGFETTLAVTNPTADRTITLPNQSGTVLVSGNASIVDADIAANAEIAVSKLADGAARQLLQTDAAGTGVEWTSNIDVPGTLDVTSTATFDSIAQYPAGSAAAPTITFTGDTNTGLFSPGSDQLALATGGTGRLFVDASGNIAAGTSATSNFGATARSFDINSAGGVANLYVKTGTVNGGLMADAGNGYMQLWTATSHPIAFNIAFSEKMRLDASGNLGLGTSTFPYATGGRTCFEVNGSSSSLLNLKYSNTVGLTVTSSASANTFESNSTLPVVFYTNGSERLRLDSSGRLGLGVSSPSEVLTVAGNIRANNTNAAISLHGTNSSSPQINLGNAAGTIHYSIYESIDGSGNRGALNFYDNVAAASRLVIDTSGRLGLGTSSPGAKLHVADAGVAVGGGNIVASIRDNTNNKGVFLGYGASEDAGVIYGANSLIFQTFNGSSWGERVRITNDGYLRLAGKGIQFNGDTADANSLDDYEEGAFTPFYATLGTNFTNITYGAQQGRYTKAGNMVRFSLYIYTTGITVGSASGDLVVGGLPFAHAGTVDTALSIYNEREFATNNPCGALVEANQTRIRLQYKTAANGGRSPMTYAELNPASGNYNLINIAGVYFV